MKMNQIYNILGGTYSPLNSSKTYTFSDTDGVGLDTSGTGTITTVISQVEQYALDWSGLKNISQIVLNNDGNIGVDKRSQQFKFEDDLLYVKHGTLESHGCRLKQPTEVGVDYLIFEIDKEGYLQTVGYSEFETNNDYKVHYNDMSSNTLCVTSVTDGIVSIDSDNEIFIGIGTDVEVLSTDFRRGLNDTYTVDTHVKLTIVDSDAGGPDTGATPLNKNLHYSLRETSYSEDATNLPFTGEYAYEGAFLEFIADDVTGDYHEVYDINNIHGFVKVSDHSKQGWYGVLGK